MLPQNNIEATMNVKLLYNIGATLDIPTGYYLKGKYGESILLGGLGMLTGVVGGGNMFKSTILHYMLLSAVNRISTSTQTSAVTYDTEINIHEPHLRMFTNRFNNLKNKDLFADGTWTITDKTVYYADEWWELQKQYCKDKLACKEKLFVETPFLTRDAKTLLKVIVPTFGQVDSFSDFETSDVGKIQDENALGDSGGNTIHMRQGLAKTRFLMEAPRVAGSANHFMLLTAQVGEFLNVGASPYAPPPPKQLQSMAANQKMKGVTGKFTFLMSSCWQCIKAAPLLNSGTRGPEYPRNSNDNVSGDTDLNIVTIKQLRNKSGPSGITLDIILSQAEGVLAELTEFHYIKENGRFGLGGNVQNYYLELLPDVKLSRTTVRGKLDNDPKLRRAMNITSELCQMHIFYRNMSHELMSAKDLYEKIRAKGYDWDFILENTRGWWTFNNDKHPLYFLSTYDLVRMANGEYHPYWLEDDNKTIKKQFQVKT